MIEKSVFFQSVRWCLIATLILWFGQGRADPSPPLVLMDDFNQPSAVAVDDRGRVYVLDGLNGKISVFTADGQRLRRIALKDHSTNQRTFAMDLTIADGRLYVADPDRHRIAIHDLQGHFLSFITPPPGPEGAVEPVALAVHEGRLAWSDRRHHRLCWTDLKNFQNDGCQGEWGEKNHAFQYPFMMDSDERGYLHVVDILNGRGRLFDPLARPSGQMGTFGLSPGRLFRPNGIVATDGGRLFVSDALFGHIHVFRDRAFIGYLSSANGIPWRLDTPVGMHVWRDRLYVVEMGKNRVRVLALSSPVTHPPDDDRETLSQKNCITCHLSWSKRFRPGQWPESPASIDPVASKAVCMSCHHGAVIDSRPNLGNGHQHVDIHQENGEKNSARPAQRQKIDPLPARFPRTGENALYCGSCHTPHRQPNDDYRTGRGHHNDWLRPSERPRESCRQCHGSKESRFNTKKRLRGQNHPLDIRLQKPGTGNREKSTGLKTLWKGLPKSLQEHGARLDDQRGLLCHTCHRAHGGVGEALLLMDNREGQLCAVCHETIHSTDPKTARKKGVHPVNVDLKPPVRWGQKKISKMGCTTCHAVHDGRAGTASLSKTVERPCQTCHERLTATTSEKAREKGIHPTGSKLKKPVRIGKKKIDRLTCQTCHAVHEGQKNSPALVQPAKKLCPACHPQQHATDKKNARRQGIHPVNLKLDETVRIGEKTTREVTCLTCHSVHKGVRHTPALRIRQTDGGLCRPCHKKESAVAGSDHDLTITAAHSRNPFHKTPAESGVCGGCHALHRGGKTGKNLLISDTTIDPGLERKQLAIGDERCLGCHRKSGIADKKPITRFHHPHEDMVLRSDPNIMPLLDDRGRIAEFGRIGCITCHDPHRWRPDGKPSTTGKNREGTVLDSFLRRQRIEGTFCVECHGPETRIKYKFFHDVRSHDEALATIR